MNLVFEREDNEVKLPTRGTPLSSGLDFYTPEEVVIPAGKDALISLGLRVAIPPGYDLVMHNKSGRATKDKIFVGACVIDADYEGIIHAHLFNLGDKDVVLEKGTKIVQGIVRKVELCEVSEGIIARGSQRGEGGFGSTSLK